MLWVRGMSVPLLVYMDSEDKITLTQLRKHYMVNRDFFKLEVSMPARKPLGFKTNTEHDFFKAWRFPCRQENLGRQGYLNYSTKTYVQRFFFFFFKGVKKRIPKNYVWYTFFWFLFFVYNIIVMKKIMFKKR